MIQASSLLNIFPSRSFVDVLFFFLLRPNEEMYMSRVVACTGCAFIQAQRAIQRLIVSGLVRKKVQNKKTFYFLNVQHPSIRYLKHVILEALLSSHAIQKILKPLQKKVHYGFIFGSAARGDDTATSDLDFFFVGDLSFLEMSSALYALGKALQRECNGVYYSLSDFQAKMVNPSSFILGVLKGPKIWLCGDERDILQAITLIAA